MDEFPRQDTLTEMLLFMHSCLMVKLVNGVYIIEFLAHWIFNK